MPVFGLGWVVCFVQHALEKTSSILCVFLMNLSLNMQLSPQLFCKENFSQADKIKIIQIWVKMNLALRRSLLLRPVRRHNKCCLIFVIRSCEMCCILLTGRWDNPSHLRMLKKGNEFPFHPTVYCHLLELQAPPKSCLCAAAPELREI